MKVTLNTISLNPNLIQLTFQNIECRHVKYYMEIDLDD
jgi:hypothetical protein